MLRRLWQLFMAMEHRKTGHPWSWSRPFGPGTSVCVCGDEFPSDDPSVRCLPPELEEIIRDPGRRR